MPRTMGLTDLFFVWIACNTFLIIKSEPAQWLLRYEPGKNISFELNNGALRRLSELKQRPIKVISAIGDARVGKSTTLNFIRHAWKSSALGYEDDGNVEEVFKTGHEHDTVTHGIWMSLWREDDENIVLLDVEGIDMGNDAATYHLSMFTALMSSGFGVFCSGTVTNHIINFLYTLPRASEVFKEIEESKNFGHLHVVVREPLQPPPGKTLERVVKDKIYSTTQGAANEKTALIAKYFPAYETGVSEIPRAVNLKQKPDIKHNPEYWDAIKTLSGRFKRLPAKKTVDGALVNGAVMATIAEILAERMTNDSWMDIGDTYIIIEKLACASSYRTHIEPILRMTSSSADVEARISPSVRKYKRECALETEIENAEKELKGRIELLRFSEEKDQEIKKLKDKLNEEKQRREQAEHMFDEESCGSSYWTWLAGGGILLGMGVGMAFSDIKLKQDITTVTPSKYNVLGLREVAWVWNGDARRLGLSGEARGVIAQEVEQLYPWVLVTGPDGYKRVNYTALDLMVVACKANEVLSSFPFKSPWPSRNLALRC